MSFESGGREIMSKSRPSIVSPLPRAALTSRMNMCRISAFGSGGNMRQYQQLDIGLVGDPRRLDRRRVIVDRIPRHLRLPLMTGLIE